MFNKISLIFVFAFLLVMSFGVISFAQPVNGNASQNLAQLTKQGLKNLRIGVTTSQYDNIPSVLKALGIPFRFTKNSVQPLNDFNVIFIGCATSEVFDPAQIRKFVERGGVLYVSDLSFYFLQQAFPEIVPRWAKDGPVGTLNCEVVDPALSNSLGKWIPLNFNLQSWAYPIKFSKNVEVLITFIAPKGKIAVAFTFAFGDGKVVYTSFHNHANTTQIEQALIAYLVVTPISSAKEIQEQKSPENKNAQVGKDEQQSQKPAKPNAKREPKAKKEKSRPRWRLPSTNK